MQLIHRLRIKELHTRLSQMDSLQNGACDSSQPSPGTGEKSFLVGAPFEGWDLYPTNLDAYDPMITNGEYYNFHLRALSSTLFCKLPTSTKVDIIDVYGEKQTSRRSLYLRS